MGLHVNRTGGLGRGAEVDEFTIDLGPGVPIISHMDSCFLPYQYLIRFLKMFMDMQTQTLAKTGIISAYLLKYKWTCII